MMQRYEIILRLPTDGAAYFLQCSLTAPIHADVAQRERCKLRDGGEAATYAEDSALPRPLSRHPVGGGTKKRPADASRADRPKTKHYLTLLWF